MSDPIGGFLARQPLMVLDGGLATELERRGADLADPLWSAKILLERPDMIRAVHLGYFEAGADVATTSTYQATFEGFERRGLDRDAAAGLMRDAVSLASAARDDFWSQPSNRGARSKPLVAASVGPYGAFLADGSEYRGRYKVSDRMLAQFHGPRLEVLARSGADLLACETFPCLREALVIVRLLEQYPSISAWISFSCRDGIRNCEGEEIARCAAALEGSVQVAAVGVNCTAPGYVAALLRSMRERTGKPLLAYPNSGQTYDPAAKRWSAPQTGKPFAAHARDWYDAGARLIGGCCRTTPEDIQGITRIRSAI